MRGTLRGFVALLGIAGAYACLFWRPAWFVSGFAVLAIVGAVMGLLEPVFKRRSERRAEAARKLEKCSHGVAALGENCLQCRADREQTERLRKMLSDASELSRSELDRLRTAWRQRTESFFVMPWQQFEDEIARCFEKQGYEVKQTNRTNDGGFDGIVTKENRKYLFECKSGNQNIGRPDIQKFHSAMITERAEGKYFNTGTFSAEAREYARKSNVEIIDRPRLARFVALSYPIQLDSTSISLMCSTCGETIRVRGLPAEAWCSTGHLIKNEITAGMIAKHTKPGPANNRKRYRNRRYWQNRKRSSAPPETTP